MFLIRDTVDLNKQAIICDNGSSLTYGQLQVYSVAIGEKLLKRSLVYIISDFSIETLSFYYASLDNGVVPLLLDKELEVGLIDRLIDNYEPQYIWIKRNHKWLLHTDRKIQIVEQYENHVLVLFPQHIQFPLYEDLAVLLSTSGSTGSPKLVRLSYKNIICNVKAIVEFVKPRESDRFLLSLPYSHSFSLAWLHMHWYIGGTILVSEHSILSEEFWEFFEKQKTTNFIGVPFSFEMLDRVNFLENSYSSLRYIAETGGKLREDIQFRYGTELNKKGIQLYIIYGQTESTLGITSIPPDEVTKKLGSVGIPMSKDIHIHLKQSGEVVVNSDIVCLGYAKKKSDLGLGDCNKGINLTGDIGRLDQDGYLYLHGRRTRFIKILGLRISLDDVEALINQTNRYGSSACIGEDGLLQVFCTCDEEKANEIPQYLSQKILLSQAFIKVSAIEDIPRKTNGKIDYKKLEMM